MPHWSERSIFYHIYPLGLCGAPERNDPEAPPSPRLARLTEWAAHARDLGCTALYLGPVFESSTHGYDTVDYFQVDRRLGTNALLAEVLQAYRDRGFRIILDGVFNHVGREFWAFRNVREQGEASAYCGWFQDLTFGPRNACGDPFTYATWNGHESLVKLNLKDPEVRAHLFEAVASWVQDYDIDGLRLDAADHLDPDFLRALSAWCRGLKPDFWLLGEVIRGDYRRWANPEMLDSVTNYEVYKGLYSSFNDHNCFEIAFSLQRQFGPQGLYRGLPLYAFADNHDVDRVASTLRDPRHLVPLYGLLFTLPGVPSVYYGSEWGWTGKKGPGTDAPLRPELELASALRAAPHPELASLLRRLAVLRHASPALSAGDYGQVTVAAEQLAFRRRQGEDEVLVAINAAEVPSILPLSLPDLRGRRGVDLFQAGYEVEFREQMTHLEVPAHGVRILRLN